MEDNFTVVTNELETMPTQQEEAPKGEEQEASTDDVTPTSKDESKENKEQDNQGHSRYQKRIDKLVGQREAAERKAQELEDKLRSYEAKKETPSSDEVDDKEISPLDYDTYEEYEAALNKQRTKSHKPKENKEAPKESDRTFESAVRVLDDLFEDAREKYTDFDNLIKNPNVPITRDMVIALSELEKAGDVAYYLATNESKAKEIAQLSPYKQAIELGKIEEKLLAKPTKKVSNAPEPIDPVKPSGDVSKTDPSKMSYAEYEKYMNAQEGKKSKFW